MNSSFALLIAVMILVGFAVLRIPLYVSIMVTALYFINHMALTGTIQVMVEGLAKSSLLSIPFFVLCGSFMKESSLGKRLVNLFIVIFRRMKAGLSLAVLVSNAFFGAISGSAPAAVATFGKIMYEPMEEKYGTKLGLGLIVSSGALSTIIPPSITLIVYGAATNTSVAQLFKAGPLPGMVIVLVIAIYLVFKSRNIKPEDYSASIEKDGRRVYKNETMQVEAELTFGKAFLSSLPVLVLPLIILGGIYGGLFTPSEAAAIACFYSCIASILMKDVSVKDLPQIFKGAMLTSAQIMILIAASTAFANAATVAQIPKLVSAALAGTGKIGFLLMLNILLLIVGCFFEPGAACLILGPLLLPTALELGIDPIHLGIIFCVNLSIGMFTPPFGLNIFVAQGILKKSMGEISKALIPFIILYVVALIIITYIPQISLALPRLLS